MVFSVKQSVSQLPFLQSSTTFIYLDVTDTHCIHDMEVALCYSSKPPWKFSAKKIIRWIFFYIYKKRFCTVQAPTGRCIRAECERVKNTWERERLLRPSHILRVVLETVEADRSPVIHPSYITAAAATVAYSHAKCPLWQLSLSYLDFFFCRQHDSDTELTCLELWGVRLDNLIARSIFALEKTSSQTNKNEKKLQCFNFQNSHLYC